MKRYNKFIILPVIYFLFGFSINGQSAQSTENKNAWQSIIGKLLSIDKTTRKAVITTSDNKEISFQIDEKAIFLRVKPNEKTLDNAVKISLNELSKDLQILARGIYSTSGTFVAQMVIVVSNSEINAKEIVNKNSLQGVVTGIDPIKKQLKLSVISPENKKEDFLDLSSPGIKIFRYATGSLKFSNSALSEFNKVKVGDQIKASGDTSADGKLFNPETVVFGTFRTFIGKVSEIGAGKYFIIEDLQSKRKIRIEIGQESNLKKLEPEKSDELIKNYFKNNENPGEKKNLRTFFDELPLIALDRLIIGDSLIVSGSVSEDEKTINAFYLLKNAEEIIKYIEKLKQKGKPLPNLGGLNL
jgi:hypothetical protein